MTRKDHLVELTAALVGSGRWTGEEEAVVETAGHLLAEIERACGDAMDGPVSASEFGPQVFTPKHHASCKDQNCNRSCMSESIDEAVADEREREGVYTVEFDAPDFDTAERRVRLWAAAPELLEALKGEATEIDGRLCWCAQPNMIKYRGHDGGCESNRELVAKATGEGAR